MKFDMLRINTKLPSMIDNTGGKIVRILLVEDNPAEARLTMEALGEAGIAHELDHVSDGEAAMAFLRKEEAYINGQRPDMIFLDLNMPRKDGRQVLREIKADLSLASIPVIVITNSQAKEDVDDVYRLRANCYLVKPPDLNEFFSMIQRVVDFWWLTARLPSEPIFMNFSAPPNEPIALR